jgi:superoxide dismutase
MEQTRLYVLPQLPYGYGDLQPYMSEEQLRIHHSKHHQAYVNGANAILQRLDKARKENIEIDVKDTHYIDYKNDRGKFVEAFWKIVNWDEVSRRQEEALK